MVPGIRCPIQGQQSGTERRCADRFKRSWKPRLEELYARQLEARTPSLSVSPETFVASAPASPVREMPARVSVARQRGEDEDEHEHGDGNRVTETSPLLAGRLGRPRNRWVVRSYSAMRSRDLVYIAGRLESRTPPASPRGESTASARRSTIRKQRCDVPQQGQQDLDLEAGRPRQEDEKSREGSLQPSALGDGGGGGDDDDDETAIRVKRMTVICKSVGQALLFLIAAIWVFMIVMALRERYGLVCEPEPEMEAPIGTERW